MNKKILSIILVLCMTASLLAGCSKGKDTTDNAATQTTQTADTAAETKQEETKKTETKQEEQTAPVVIADDKQEETPAQPADVTLPDPVYYYSCDAADGNDGIVAAVQNLKAAGTLADPIVTENTEKEIKRVNGVKGDALYIDGSYGYKLNKINGVGDSYTVSFWVHAERFATYMPTVQFGPDIHGDLTGGQHYVNFTRTEWSGEAAYPCIWAYDQADNAKWPNWAPPVGEGEHVKEWINVTLAVDENKMSEDGEYYLASLYVNGKLYSDAISIVLNTMQQSDNFEFLLGVNHWDAIFKGAMDEIYVFDKALNADQVGVLVSRGDATQTYVAPEHIFEFYKEEGAIDSIGNEALTTAWWTDWSKSFPIKDGETWQVKLHNWSDGLNSWDNYLVGFANMEITPHSDPTQLEGYTEYAMVRADAYGWTPAGNIDEKAFTYTWGNWNTWSNKVMRDADVTMTIARSGDTISIEADNVDYNEASNVMRATIPTTLTEDAPCYFFFTCEASYVDIISVKDKTVHANAGITVGTSACDSAFWTQFSPIWAVPSGTSRTFSFTNFTDGANAWDNYLIILQSTPNGHAAADAEGYKEYAVLRADNWGWGDNFSNADADKYCEWDWTQFNSIMDGAHVEVTVENYDGIANVYVVVTTADGTKYPQNYYNIAVDGDLYTCFTLEKAQLIFDSNVVGATDCSAPFWTAFSDIWEVPAGGSKSISFRNYTDGANAWDNYLLILQSTPYGHAAADAEGYKEYAVLRADSWGWGDGFANTDADKESNWDWTTFNSDMDGAYVDMTICNDGTTATVDIHVTTESGKTYFQKYKNIAVDGTVYACLTMEKAYVVIDADQIGNSADNMGFWTQFSPIWKVADGTTKSISFTNYTDGANAWDNFLVILQATPTGHAAADTEGYKEYAVLRADNWGWGDNFANTDDDKTTNFVWDTFAEDMYGANCLIDVTNAGGQATVDIYVNTKSGKTYHQNYRNIAVDGDLYVSLTGEKCHFVID